jgi:hypothetical protein
MTLRSDARHILRRAWSARLLYLAGLLTACEVLLPYFADSLPRGIFATLNLLVIPAALVARVTAQKDFQDAA